MSVAPLLQVEAAFFRRQMPDLVLRPGATFAARVAERHGQHGIITLAGHPLVAQLPDDVQAGDTLRLLVADTRGEKVLMKLVQEQPAAPPPPPTVTIAQPDGSQARLTVDRDAGEEGGGGRDAEHAAIGLTYETPRLGAVGLRLELAPGAIRVRAEVRAGRVHELAADAADALVRQIAARTGRAVEVTVVPREEHVVDAYA